MLNMHGLLSNLYCKKVIASIINNKNNIKGIETIGIPHMCIIV